MRQRLSHISFLQFIGPILVILGHSTNSVPSSEAYHVFSKVWIYLFHMPLFFFIAGYLFSYKEGLRAMSYQEFIKGKFQRLLFPYIIWNAVFVFPKVLLTRYITDDISYSLPYWLKLITIPRANILGHTWFLAALFLLFILAPVFNVLLHIKDKKMLLWCIVTAFLIYLYLFPIQTEVLSLRDLSKDTLFFWLGIMFGSVPLERLQSIFRKPVTAVGLLLITSALTVIRLGLSDLSIITMLTCLFSILTLFAIPIVLNLESNLIEGLAQRSFGIYILHWPFMITARIFCFQVMNLDSTLVIILMVLCGFFIPNVLLSLAEKLNIRHFHRAQKYLLGI